MNEIVVDDTEIVESMVAANAGQATKGQDFIYELGSHYQEEPNPPIPGDRVFPGVSESNQRYFYEHWRKVTSEDEES